MVSKPKVFHSPSSNTPSPIAVFTVGISHWMLSRVMFPLPLNHPTARKAIPFGLLSARATPAAIRPAASERYGHACSGHHADRHRLAVQQLLVAGERLEGVADRVSEVEHAAAAADLLLVLGHHPRLVADARGDHRDDDLALEADH